MGVVIEGAVSLRPTRWPGSHGARRLADAAVRRCLEASGRDASELDVLINAGVYRERGLGEPALAALIQEDVHANPSRTSYGHGTFSFDIANGACGVLTGAHIARSFLASGAADLAMVVASDSGPGPVHSRWCPYPEAGAALLLARGEAEGFAAFRFDTFPEYAALAEGFWEWHDGPGGTGRQRLHVSERRGFRERAAECAVESGGKLLADLGVPARDIDLLIATPEPGFADQVADGLGVAREKTMHVGERLGRMHTAQPVAAITLAMRTDRWPESGTVLLVSAGAGITIGSALYRT